LVVDTRAEVSVCTKPMVDLLKLKSKTMMVVVIDGVKQTSLGNAGLVIVKVMN